MAAVLDALAPYVKKLIKDMAEEEVSMLLGVSGEITKLDGTMESLKAFVSDAERRRITDQSVQRCVNKLKDAMYDATDIMELCQLEAEERRELELGEGGNREQNLLACCQPLLVCLRNPIVSLITCGGIQKMQDFFQRFLFCLRNPVFAHEMGSRIKELNQRLEGIFKEANNFKFDISLGSSKPELRNQTAGAELSSYKTISRVDESAIVGEQIERDTKELVQVLTADDKNHDIKVVSIVGTGGMGKTTLAQKIFNDAAIQKHFKTKRMWLSITREFDEAELLRTAIKHARGNHDGEQDKSILTDALIDALSTMGRFLLVMDDVWCQKAWNDVLKDPVRIASKKQPGSRVLVTTRSAILPQQMQAALHQHLVRPLDNDDAWSLLKKQLQPDQREENHSSDHTQAQALQGVK
ncbi:putative disease resistance protein RGA3 isoform X2 [Miscanthus floridulus]|uniref:putative disease resistance protein RGA3 isoform X2 n=1 Tax=Miscanthus floridulus TaxID=154761 RepID=UPI003458FB15